MKQQLIPRKNRLKRDERRKQILKCAVKVFSQSNYKAARMSDIAQEVGVSEAAIYKYFPSKKAIFMEILEHMSSRIITIWDDIVNEEDDVEATLAIMNKMYFQGMIEHPEELRIQFQAISEIRDPDIRQRLKEDHGMYVSLFEKVLKKGMKKGIFRKDLEVRTLAWMLNGMSVLVNLARLLSYDDEFDENMIHRITSYMIEGVKI